MKMIKQSFECVTDDDFSTWPERIEKLARICYKSEDKITEGSAAILLEKLIHSGHNTMIEFVDLTFKFTVDTKIASALGRHRLTTQAHESTHYIDYDKNGELVFIKQVDANFEANEWIENILSQIEIEYFSLRNKGVPHTLARTILPFALKTEMHMKANLAEWRHILRLRSSGKDHPQMDALMHDLLRWFKVFLPAFVKDIPYESR